MAVSRKRQLREWLNAVLDRADVALIHVDELRGLRTLVDHAKDLGPASTLAPEPLDAPRADAPRLAELKRRYAGHPASASSVWSEEFIAAEVSLAHFRGDNAYIWQSRDSYVARGEEAAMAVPTGQLNYLASAYYVRAVDRLGLLDRLGDDATFGNVMVQVADDWWVSRDLLDSVLELDFLDRHLDLRSWPPFEVLDIGAGYGRLAYRLTQAFTNVERVLCTDGVAQSSYLCEHYLRFRGALDRAEVVPLDEIEARLTRTSISLATNVHSFSECPLATITWWLDLLAAQRVPALFIVPNHGTELLSTEPDGRHLDYAPLLAERGYERVALEPKYRLSSALQQYGIFPSHLHLFALAA